MPRHNQLRRRALIFVHLVLVLIGACSIPRRAGALERFWITATGGGWGTPGLADADWSASDGGAGNATAPTTGDVANFTLPNTYDVTFSTNVTNSELEIENGSVTFDLEGFTYTATTTGAIDVGKVAGQTGRLTVLDGTVAVDTISDDVFVGLFNDSTGFLTIGTGGQVGTAATRPEVLIGHFGTGTLTIQNDGQMFATSFDVGNNEGSSGTVSVTGPQALLDASGTIFVGDAGTGTMTVSGGAELVSSSSTQIGDNAGISGTVTITGAGSTWVQTSAVTVGQAGVGTLNVQSGAALSTGTGTIGFENGSFGTVNISGAGSTWTLSNSLVVSNNGEAIMNVTGGGHVSSTSFWSIGNSTGQGTATVSGTGSRVDIVGDVLVGSVGDGTLTISSGGQVTSEEGLIATSMNTGIGEVTITGAGSSWTTTSNFTVGSVGTGTVTVENGGNLTVGTTLSLGDPLGAPIGTLNFYGGTITADGYSRLGAAVLNWTDGTFTIVGGTYFNSAGGALILNGADADDRPTLRLTTGSSTTGSQMGALIVGHDRGGALEVTGGSLLQVPTLSIGTGDGGDGEVTVSGNGSSLSATSNNINVGGTGSAAGGAGTLTIETGASASTAIAGQLRLWAGGTVNVNGGTLNYGTMTFNGGQVNFNSGRIEQYNNLSADTNTLTTLLGTAHELGTGRTLGTAGTATVSSDLDINGGRLQGNILSVSSVGGGSTIFKLRGGGTAQFNNGVTLGADTRTFIDDGTLNAGTDVFQQGELYLSTTSRVSGSSLQNSGLISGSGRIDAVLNNALSGEVRIADGQRIVFNGLTNGNDGLIDVNGGEAEFALGSLTNSNAGPSTGFIIARNATLRFGGGLTNNGAMTFTSGVSEVFGDITNTNALATPGRIIVSGGAQANFYDDVTNSGLIQVSAAGSLASTAVFLGSLTGLGVSGGGHVFEEGDMRPGFSAGTMAFGGDLSFGPLAALEIELFGPTPGTQFDRVTVVKEVALAGALEVELRGGYTPAAGSSFEILTAGGGIEGTFDSAVLPALAGANWQLLYSANSLLLRVALPGDYNADGTVDAADYLVWRKTVGQSGFALAADGDADNQIDADDYDVWQTHFGESIGGGAGGVAFQASIPEPTSLALVVLAVAIGMTRGPRAVVGATRCRSRCRFTGTAHIPRPAVAALWVNDFTHCVGHS